MPTDGFEQFVRMAVAFGLVAAVAVPAGLVGWRHGRRATAESLPAPAVDDPVFALAYLGLFVGQQVLVAVLGQVANARLLGIGHQPDASVWQSVVGSLLAAPVVAAGWVWYRGWWTWPAAARAVAVGTVGWLLASPAVYAAHAGAEWASGLVGVVPEEHPLVRVVKAADGPQAVALFAAVAVATPFAEEVMFRGLLLGWLIRRPAWAALPVGTAALFALGTTAGTVRLMAVGLLALLVVGLVAVRSRPTLVAVWATATLFALVHSSVWPTPVPLFLLGLALGRVAIRTGGVLAGTVLHGLFNAVSLVYLLRG